MLSLFQSFIKVLVLLLLLKYFIVYLLILCQTGQRNLVGMNESTAVLLINDIKSFRS